MKLQQDAEALVTERAEERVGDEDARARLGRLGFSDDGRALEALDVLLGAGIDDVSLAALLRGCGESAEPARALVNAERLLTADDRPPCPVDGRDLGRFLGASQHMADILQSRPTLLTVLGPHLDIDGLAARYAAAAEGDDRDQAMRRAQSEDQLKIAWDDIVAGVDVEHVTWMISRLADEIVRAAAHALGADRHFAVIALGKLGGSELNYSSDIDLIFVRPDDATDQQTADLIGRRLIHLLDKQTPDGHLYRVDMRLRPEGSAGLLTRTLAACSSYYRERGRPWERQMLMKARAISECRDAGESFVADTRQWVLDVGLDAAAIRQFKRLKATTEARHASPDGRLDVKQAPGGIRDIETIVQFVTLQHVRRAPDLISASTLHGLEKLRVAGAIGSIEAAWLRSAYRFHRRLENLVQVMHRVQTHRLPADHTPVARLMGQRDAESFDATFGEHRDRVRSLFDAHFTRAFADVERPTSVITEYLLGRIAVPTQDVEPMLADLGYPNPSASLEVLHRAAAPSSRFLPTTPRLVSAFASVAPRLLERISLAPNPDAALDRFEKMTRGVGAREVLYSQLVDEPRLLDVLCDLAAGSPHLADLLIQEPHIFDGFIDSLLTGVRGKKERRQLLLDAARDLGDPWLLLSDHKKLETLRIGVRDLRDVAPVRETLSDLSHLCIDVLRTSYRVVSAAARAEHGDPMSIRGIARRASAVMTVLAMGKLGGLEANYASDADLVFVYSGDGETETTGIANRVFFTKVAEDFLAQLMGARGTPRLYRIDTRLRPEGNGGPLVSTLRSFEDYYRSGRAAAFEMQALLKARVVSGDAELGQRVLGLIRDLHRRWEAPDDLAEQMRTMRDKIAAAGDAMDLKRAPGGMVDVEFITQFLQLKYGRTTPSVLVQETPRALTLLANAGALPSHVADRLTDAYLWMRRVEMRLQITAAVDSKEVPSDPRQLRDLALRLGYADTSEGDASLMFLNDLEATRTEVRQQYDTRIV